MTGKVFLITGTSTGFGEELVKKVIDAGDKVVATARNSSKLSPPQKSSKDNYLAVDLDVTQTSSIHEAFGKALKQFGRVDVVVNNAGYGLSGEFESVSEKQVRTQMEVNFFGLANVTREALKTMREQKPSGGVIQQITSIGGQRGVPTFSIYCASKFAVEGLTESIAAELKPEWNIHMQCVEPGGFRTDWSGRSMDFGDSKEPAYDHIDAKTNASKRHGTQPGDPVKGAAAMYELAVMKDPPPRCVLGSDAFKVINQKIENYTKLVEAHKDISLSCDVDE